MGNRPSRVRFIGLSALFFAAIRIALRISAADRCKFNVDRRQIFVCQHWGLHCGFMLWAKYRGSPCSSAGLPYGQVNIPQSHRLSDRRYVLEVQQTNSRGWVGGWATSAMLHLCIAPYLTFPDLAFPSAAIAAGVEQEGICMSSFPTCQGSGWVGG